MKKQSNTIKSRALSRFLQSTGIAGLLPALVLLFSIQSNYAGSATWKTTPHTGDWNTPGNWSPATVPNASSDTATFATSSITNIALSASTEVNGIVYSGANAYTISDNGFTSTLSGVGVTNNSGITQNFVIGGRNNVGSGQLGFLNSATAGASTAYDIQGSTSQGNYGSVVFAESSTAGSANFTFEGSGVSGYNGGDAFFEDTTNLDNANFTLRGATVSGGGGGYILLTQTNTNAIAGNFTLNGGTVAGAGASGAVFEFTNGLDISGNYTLGGGNGSGAGGAYMSLGVNSVSAVNGGWTVGGGTSGGNGAVMYFYAATMGDANGPWAINGGDDGGTGAEVQFYPGAMGNADGPWTIGGGSNGGYPASLYFGPTSMGNLGGDWTIGGGSVSGNYGGILSFDPGSVGDIGGNWTINGGTVSDAFGGYVEFSPGTVNNITGVWTIDGGTVSSAGGGSVAFFNTAQAGGATFIIHGGTVSGAQGGSTVFHDTSSAAAADFTILGGDVSDASPGSVLFLDGSGADSAILDASGGGGIYFLNDSQGENAQIDVTNNGFMDLSNHNTPGISIGPLTGDGTVFLGANNLTIFAGSEPMEFDGLITDNGAGGSVTINGPAVVNAEAVLGSLQFTGSLTVRGFSGFQVDVGNEPGGGILDVGSVGLVECILRHSQGHVHHDSVLQQSTAEEVTLGGKGIAPNHTLLPGVASSDPVLEVDGNYLLEAGCILSLQIGGTDSASYAQVQVGGATTLAEGAILDLSFVNGFAPHTGDTFNLLTSGSMTGSFSTVTVEGLATGWQYNLTQDGNGKFQLISLNNGFPAITLKGKGHKVGGVNTVRLTWSGATATDMDVYRNGILIITPPNNGKYIDSTGDTGPAKYKYQVCDAGTSTCSNIVTVKFAQ